MLKINELYNTILAFAWQLTVQNLDQLYVMVSSAHKTSHRNMTYTMC